MLAAAAERFSLERVDVLLVAFPSAGGASITASGSSTVSGVPSSWADSMQRLVSAQEGAPDTAGMQGPEPAHAVLSPAF
jgi:hypothetical protein